MKQNDLNIYLKDRPKQLKEAKKKGVKVIGYLPGNYVPEEIIYASGAIPICLCHGGDSKPAESALAKVPDVVCPFARAQIGERMLEKNPYYKLIDMVVAPITCQHIKKVAEVWEYQADIPIFKLGVPHQYDTNFTLEYYADRLTKLVDTLQIFTRNVITNEKLHEAISIYNRMRELLRNISLLRRNHNPPITTLEFIKINHASFYADPADMVDQLESIYDEIKTKQVPDKTDAPRLLLMGPNIAYGDYKVLELIQSAGGEVVAEEFCEGVRYYWENVENKGNPVQALAKSYLVNKLPCAFMRRSAKKRLDFALRLVRDFNISGVIWYELLACETYDAESYFFAEKMAEQNIPFLVLESNYGMADIGQLKVRIEAFIEQIKGI